MIYSGGCSCGAVRYEASVAPVIQGNCHCAHCRKSTGSGYSANLFFPELALRIEGETRAFTGGGESGSSTLVFCPVCGTSLLSKPATMAGLVAVKAGTLDDPNLYKPTADIFVRSAAAWDHMDAALPKFETCPPMG